MLRLNIFLSLLPVGKYFFIRVRKLCPIFLVTFLLYGGLYQRMLFRFLFFFFVGSVGSVTYADIRNHVEPFGIRVLLDRNMLCWMRGMKVAC